MNKSARAVLRNMFGGRCAYCGIVLSDNWHADHVEPVCRDGNFVDGRWKTNGRLRKPENHRSDNYFPSCVPCNILKSNGSVEDLRRALAYFARSIPAIRTYSHVRHLMRFGKLHIEASPVIFWFEKWRKDARRKSA